MVLAAMLRELFCSNEKYEKFIAKLNEAAGDKTMQRYIWSSRLDIVKHRLTKGRNAKDLTDVLNDGLSNYVSLEVVDRQQASREYRLHSTSDTQLNVDIMPTGKLGLHYYTDSDSPVVVEKLCKGNDVDIDRLNLCRFMIRDDINGCLKNARLRMYNTEFKSGILSPWDIVNKIYIEKFDEAPQDEDSEASEV